MNSIMRNAVITYYFQLGLKQCEILAFLALEHNEYISLRTLKRILKQLKLYRRRNYSNYQGVADFIQNQVRHSGQLHGYRWMHLKCLQNNLVVTQETLRLLLHIIDPIGIKTRKRRRLQRRKYYNKGPNYVWHLNSYDKLKPYGIAINGCIDGFSRRIIWVEAGTTNNDPKVIARYFIEAVRKYGGCPRKLRADMGTENRYVEQMQLFLRKGSSAEEGVQSVFIYGRSPHNQRIEAWWSILRKHNSQFWMNIFQKIKDDGFFSGSFLDKSLIQFCFLKLIKKELQQVVMEWNIHRIRGVRNGNCPVGRPIIMYHLPEIYFTKNYICEADNEEVDTCFYECSKYEELPCDIDVFHLACMIMTEKNWLAATNAYDAINLYFDLRQEILNLL